MIVWLVDSTAGATPAGEVMLSASFALVCLRLFANRILAMPSATVHLARRGFTMKRAMLLFVSVADTLFALGAGVLASCLLAKYSSL